MKRKGFVFYYGKQVNEAIELEDAANADFGGVLGAMAGEASTGAGAIEAVAAAQVAF